MVFTSINEVALSQYSIHKAHSGQNVVKKATHKL